MNMLSRSQVRNFILFLSALGLVFAFENCGVPGGADQSTDSSSQAQLGVCALAPSSLRNPSSIDQVTQLINALPKPLSISCLIENLPAPLKVFAMNSALSAQPSVGINNPRIFIINGNLVLSVVPAGIGKNLLEYGQLINFSESVKAELTFPIPDGIPYSRPYSQIRSGVTTSCRSCHSSERSVAGFSGDALASAVLRPDPFNRQTSARLRGIAAQCDKASDPYRCEMLNSIFIKGRAQDADFP